MPVASPVAISRGYEEQASRARVAVVFQIGSRSLCPARAQEDHGWGHSVFTGRPIPEGTPVFSGGVLDDAAKAKVSGDLFVPVYDWETLDGGVGPAAGAAGTAGAAATGAKTSDDYDYDDAVQTPREQESMLFQETWNGDDFPAVVLESLESMRVYMPGLACLAPCAAEGFNLRMEDGTTYRDWRPRPGEGLRYAGEPSPQAGSFSYLSNTAFVASRDIQAGEELVVECPGDSDEFSPKVSDGR